MTMYQLKNEAYEVALKFARQLNPELAKTLLSDLNGANLLPQNDIGTMVEFVLPDSDPPKSGGLGDYGIEGVVNDADGAEMIVLLHTDSNGRLKDIELIRFHNGCVIQPDWTTLRFVDAS